MGQELHQLGIVHVAQVVHHGEKLILPERMNIPEAIALLMEREKYLQQEVVITENMDVFPWEGAYALLKALQRKYGWAQAIPTPGFFGTSNPPKMLVVEVGVGKKIEVPWGRFSLPSIQGFIQTGTHTDQGRVGFSLAAAVKRNDEAPIRELFQQVVQIARDESIYRGQAIKLRFKNDDGKDVQLPRPEFIDTSEINVNQLILSQDVLDSVETNLFTPIERIRELKENGIPIKRGILLGGVYGTGKTLAATCASKLAVKNGVTFIYVTRADELDEAIKFSMRYQDPGCVIFCEDIDREMDGERTVDMDDLLNTIDGLDTKRSNIIVVLTTNHLENIHPAMLRPGRLDAVIDVTPPDAEAVQKLLRFYGRSKIAPETNLTEIGKELEGCIPAIVEEVVKRAKLAELRITEKDGTLGFISERALLESAKTMRRQLNLLNKPAEEKQDTFESVMAKAVAKGLNGGGGDASKEFTDRLTKKIVDGVVEATS